MKNYYFILGVNVDATQEEIQSAYRRLAKELHPDYYGQDSGPFLALQEAYSVLNDPNRRRAYDQSRSRQQDTVSHGVRAEPLHPANFPTEPLIPEPANFSDLSLTHSFETFTPSFEKIFDRLWQNFDPARPKVEKLEQLTVEILLTPAEALRGGHVRIMVPARLRCSRCDGYGGIGFFECWRCNGTGVVEGEYPLRVAFPSGLVNQYSVEIPLDRFGIRNLYLTVLFWVSK